MIQIKEEDDTRFRLGINQQMEGVVTHVTKGVTYIEGIPAGCLRKILRPVKEVVEALCEIPPKDAKWYKFLIENMTTKD